MTPADLATTNVWLALIAISSVVQLLIVVGLLVGAWRFYHRIESTVDRITREHIAPVSARAHQVIDEVEDVMARVRSLDDGMRRTLSRVGDGVSLATSVVRSRFWPVVGIMRGLKAGLATLGRTSAEPAARTVNKPRATVTKLSPRDKDASDVEAEQRFAYEGGSSHARS
ncbi:MAG TPA: hypothetical protein VES67_05765 [Vicinamibacterales bacterium]|nr:hypothetical protein [Vicinamibacterales bacterium]